MTAQKGFVYEQNVAKYLKPIGLVPSNFTPAGSGSDQPDLMLEYKDKKAGCELKITDASAGSLVLKYNPKDKKWGFGIIKESEKEKLFIKELADFVNLFDNINDSWKDTPYKVDKAFQDDKWKATAGKLSNRERYERDLKLFPDVKGEIPATKIEEYYGKKSTYYVNIGTHGFYLFGRNNPFDLKNVPMFSQNATAGYRARVQYKGAGNYQFTFEMNFKMRKKSQYNIGACTKASVIIVKNNVDLSCFPEL